MKKQSLNLGSGTDYKEDYINVDLDRKDIYGRKIKADVYHDLNKYPYPFEDNQFEEIYSRGLLEHIKDLEKHIKEIARISKDNCWVTISVPYFSCYMAYRELYTHKFSLNNIQLFDIFKRNKFELIDKQLIFHNIFLRWLNPLINFPFIQGFYERFLSGILPINSIIWEFQKI